jgi:hypothetical protein
LTEIVDTAADFVGSRPVNEAIPANESKVNEMAATQSIGCSEAEEEVLVSIGKKSLVDICRLTYKQSNEAQYSLATAWRRAVIGWRWWRIVSGRLRLWHICRRGCRRRTARHHRPGNRNLVPLRIHTLDKGIIVATLGSISGTLCSASTSHASEHQPGAGTHASAGLPTDGCTSNSANHGTDSSTTHTGINARAVGATRLLLGKLATIGVIVPELLKTLAAPRQGHHARARRRGNTTGKKQQRADGKQQTSR